MGYDQKLTTPANERPANPHKQESILDRPAEKNLATPVITNRKTTKSGKNGRQPVQVIEQESELTKVRYNVDSKNKRAVFANGIGIIDDYMASDNLNECVDDLLVKKSKAAFEQHAAALANAKKLADAHRNEGRTSNGMTEKTLKKNTIQNKVLTMEFKKNPVW